MSFTMTCHDMTPSDLSSNGVDVYYLLSLVISCGLEEMESLKSRLEPECKKKQAFYLI